ncbi:MAG: hypothetical protein MJ232_04895 [archaeon]|nr:hypothetical protein [archaeon]
MKIKTRKQLKQEIEELKAEIERVNDVRWMLINRLDVNYQRINNALEYINSFESIRAYLDGYSEYNYNEDFKKDIRR